ncbi:hypothetical protein SEA_YOSIF_60 [Streptomyces phage Yosif]|uniref:Transposase n=1 Tax=Streptomyces phage Yosif TaxID=2201421 RepID=A0A2Z4QBZ7_9CAUD|nr:hypothetical protein KGG71_gp60 [Streptomyces phage Yosif]AWY07624.1 hypothetical protein SEA_YOSIF_60 [Streptomyces phage Yosif]
MSQQTDLGYEATILSLQGRVAELEGEIARLRAQNRRLVVEKPHPNTLAAIATSLARRAD